jgi:uncharacterized OsmC-like protein/fermentation-respiration switch protein FrsA (DUF1100 family)
MARQKITFEGHDGSNLAALLEYPTTPPVAFALFAHCFSCGKDIAAASRISRALVARGYAVMRFDFTGLGNSDGDFANTNFSSNVGDLVAAADYLREHYDAPQLLIGHSLGGAAVIVAAHQIEEVQAVATIGAPFDPGHVTKQFSADLAEIEATGSAAVDLAGRPFTIRQQFLDDVASIDSRQLVSTLRKPLLVFHSPLDTVVSITEAEKIYSPAKHPKSFISLDKSDHLLTSKADAEYVATSIAGWASRYIGTSALLEDADTGLDRGKVMIREHNKQFTRTVNSDHHQWLSDEPVDVGGNNLGPDPYEHLLAALGTCTSMTVRMYANRKSLPLEHVSVTLKHSREHVTDCEECEDEPRKLEVLSREISFTGDLTEAQTSRLLEIADKCPVHKTLLGDIRISTTLAS